MIYSLFLFNIFVIYNFSRIYYLILYILLRVFFFFLLNVKFSCAIIAIFKSNSVFYRENSNKKTFV